MSSTAITPFRLAGLPPELVDMIWDFVFENEANNRVALVHRDTMRVVPSKTLISPLMAVDPEVRERALRYYNFKLDVNIFPGLGMQPPVTAPNNTHLNRLEGGESDPASHSVSRILHDLNDGHVATKGCLYLNLDTDRFLPSFPSGVSSDCVTAMFHRTRWVQEMGQASSSDHGFLQRCISARLSPGDCNTITSVVYKPDRTANFRYPLPWPGKLYYPASAVLEFWMANQFTKLSGPITGGKYWTMEDKGSAALAQTILQEGAKSLNLKEWQTGDDKRHGWRIWRP